MTHVLLRNGLVVKTIDGLRPLTTEESANRGIRRALDSSVTEVHIGGVATVNRSNVVTSVSDPNQQTTTQIRRTLVKAGLRFFDQAPAANWSLRGGEATRRAANYWKWIEMIASASSLDSNLSTNAFWTNIEKELDFRPEEWYLDHNEVQWTRLTLATLTTSTFYRTNKTSGVPEIVGTISMPSSWQGAVEYIYS